MTDWLDPLVLCNIGLVLATVGLMIATLVYTKATKKMSIETEKSRKTQERQYELDAMPNIRIKIEWFGIHLICYIINVGRCPALDLKTEITVQLREDSALREIPPCDVHSKLLLTNETIRFMVPHHQFDQIKKDYRSLKIVGKCKDIYDNEHNFEDELEFNLPDSSSNDKELIHELVPDDDPLMKIKKAIVEVGNKIGDNITHVAKEIKISGPTLEAHCSNCGKQYFIDNRETPHCPECGDEMKLW